MNRELLTNAQIVLDLIQTSHEYESKVGFDIESEGLHPSAKIAGFSLYFPVMKRSFYVPFISPEHVMDPSDVEKIAKAVSTLRVVTYNGQTDCGRWLHFFGCTPKMVGDSCILNKMMQGPSAHTFGLKPLALELGTTMDIISISDVLGEGNYDFTKASLHHPLLLQYTCQDAEQSYLTEEALIKRDLKLDKYPRFAEVYDLEMAILPYLGREELRGMPLDMEKFSIAVRRMEMEADDLEQEVCEELGRDPQEFNPESDQSLSAALFNKTDRVPAPLPAMKPRQRKVPKHDQRDLPGLGLTPGAKGTPKGPNLEYMYFSTAILELQRIEDQHPVIRKIIQLKHLRSIGKDVKNVDEFCKDGRLYTHFLTVGDDGTSRIYTEKPNLIGFSKTVRSAMVPPAGKIYVHIDFQAAEWRLAAILAGEISILDALDRGVDPHVATFSAMSGTPVNEVTKDQRAVGKILNYAALFGSTGYSLARSLRCTESEANTQQQKFWDTYPCLASWRDLRHDYANKHARTYTVLGRVRTLPEMFTSSGAAKAMARRRSVNTATQGSCGDCLKIAIRDFYLKAETPGTFLHTYKGRVVCPVYDAVLVELDLPPAGTDMDAWKAAATAALKEVTEVKLNYEGRSTTMRVDMGWSTDSWLAAMGK